MMRMVDTRSPICLDGLIKQGPIEKYLQRLKHHHHDSYDHSLRVALLSIDLAYENRLSGSDVRTVGFAGLLHDLGKTDIDAALLEKPSALNSEERSAVQTHPRQGFEQLEEDLYRNVKIVVAGHHEFQTTPFPRGRGDRREAQREANTERRTVDRMMIMLTQIVAIADMCDALASARPYKDPLSREQIQVILDKQFTGEQKLIEQVLRRG